MNNAAVMPHLKLVPELYCENIEVTRQFYTEVFGFKVKYERPEEQFIYFTLDGVDVMVESIAGVGRRWITGEMKKPYGRGINFQWDVINIGAIYERVTRLSPASIYLSPETKSYQCDDKVALQQQFVVKDPDGYLFRFCSDC